MKNKLYIIILIAILSISCKAQQIVNINTFNQGNNEGKYFKDINNVFDNFLGTWEYQQNNTIFRIILRKLARNKHKYTNNQSFFKDQIIGHYEKVEILATGRERLIYTSNKPNGNSNEYLRAEIIIFGGTSDGIKLSASVLDVSIPNTFPWGTLTAVIIPGSNPSQMTWKISGYNLGGRNFNIPIDIIMTKVN